MSEEVQNDNNEVTIKDPAAVLAALERAKADAKKYREEYEALSAELTPIKEELDTMKSELKTNAVKRAVKDAGADPDRVMQFMKLDGIEYKDGKLDGFDDAFETVKTALPELFDPKRRVGGRADMETGDANVQKSVSEMQAERLLRTTR